MMCYLFLCNSLSALPNHKLPSASLSFQVLPSSPAYISTLPPSHTPLFVNTDYVCGFPQTLFVKLRILQQNIFGDNCCTVFVSSIFVYCYFEENNMPFFSFLVFANFMFIHFKQMLHVTDLNCK